MEKKVSLTLTQNTYQKLSNYTKEYGLSVRYMLKVLIDDAIDNNRYPAIFNKQHIDNKHNDIVGNAQEVPAPSKIIATKKDCKNIVNDISKKIASDNSKSHDNSKKNVCSKDNGNDNVPAKDNDIFHDEDYDILLKDLGNVQSLVENKIPDDDTDINDILG